jgi:hypothetical protein
MSPVFLNQNYRYSFSTIVYVEFFFARGMPARQSTKRVIEAPSPAA